MDLLHQFVKNELMESRKEPKAEMTEILQIAMDVIAHVLWKLVGHETALLLRFDRNEGTE